MPLPHVAADVKSAVRADLSRCCMSIHLCGQNFSVVPEGGVESLLEIQNEMAIEQARGGSFFRLLWIPQGVALIDDRQRALVERLRNDSRLEPGADLLETHFEDIRTLIHERLAALRTPASTEPPPVAADAPVAQAETHIPSVYLLYDQRDAALVADCADLLFEQQLEILHPAFDGDEADVREYHEENLRTCDGVLLFHGAAGEMWIRRKLRELQKSAGYGRVKPAPTAAICPLPPRTPEKERFRTHEAMALPLADAISPASLAPFIARMRDRGEGRQA
jgi:hypothetical protein